MPIPLTDPVQAALEKAVNFAESKKHTEVTEEAFFYHLLLDPSGYFFRFFSSLGVIVKPFLEKLEKEVLGSASYAESSSPPVLSRPLLESIKRAEAIAKKWKDTHLASDHLLYAFCEKPFSSLERVCKENKLNLKSIEAKIKEIRGSQSMDSPSAESAVNALEKYCKNLTAIAKRGELDPVVGRDEEIRRTMQVLSRRTKNNPLLIGEPGVGKTAIAEGLAQRIIQGDVSDVLKDKELFVLDPSSAANFAL